MPERYLHVRRTRERTHRLRELTFEVAYYDIEELNRRAEAGETDVSKISYALLPEIQSRYTLLDSGSALGRGNGPVFVARQGTPPDSIRRVAVPGMHTTANALMSRLYPSITQKSRCSSRKSHPPWHAGSTTPGC